MPTSARMTGQVAWVDPARSPCLGLCLGLMFDAFQKLNLYFCESMDLSRFAGKSHVPFGTLRFKTWGVGSRKPNRNQTWIKHRSILARVYVCNANRTCFPWTILSFKLPSFLFKGSCSWTWKDAYFDIFCFAPGRKEQRSPADHDLRRDCLPMLGPWTNALFANLSKGAHILVCKEHLEFSILLSSPKCRLELSTFAN